MSKAKGKEYLEQKEKNNFLYTREVPQADFSPAALQARREWHEIFKVLKEKKLKSHSTLSQGHPSELKARTRVIHISKR